MPEVVFSVDQSKPMRDQAVPGHNRWHPDIPPAASVAPGSEFRVECREWTDAQLGNNDSAKAIEVWRSDRVVDDIYNALFRELITYMMEDPRNITPCTHLLFIAKNLERIGDHATNIAETVYYAVEGEVIPDVRPKGDTSAYAIVRNKE